MTKGNTKTNTTENNKLQINFGEKILDPQDYFEYVKSKKNKSSDEFLDKLHEVIQKQLGKAMITGQNLTVRRLAYALGVITRERELLSLGIDAYVLLEDIEYYIDNVSNNRAKIVDIEFFPREIPDELVEKIKILKEKNIFDNYYVLFTDYTEKITKDIKTERKKEVIRKDPIIFGAFEQNIDNLFDVCDRFYYIGDWEDEYCDLTLSKMVNEMSLKSKNDTVHPLAIPVPTEEEVRNYINQLNEDAERSRLRFRAPEKKETGLKGLWKNISTKWFKSDGN